ncbi:hypothetical protein V6O07_12375, partial [Arthrospira platensis SPKY2]
MEDVLSEESPDLLSDTVTETVFTIAYAGGLHAAYGVDALVAAIHQLDTNDVRLILYGRGDQEQQ